MTDNRLIVAAERSAQEIANYASLSSYEIKIRALADWEKTHSSHPYAMEIERKLGTSPEFTIDQGDELLVHLFGKILQGAIVPSETDTPDDELTYNLALLTEEHVTELARIHP